MMTLNVDQLKTSIQSWAEVLGFDQLAVTDLDLSAYQGDLAEWLAQHRHGEMTYMARHAEMRTQPKQLLPEGQRALVVRMDYLPDKPQFNLVYHNPRKANVSRYALNRDYHKIIRKKLAQLGKKIEHAVGKPVATRACTDSAPIMEKPLAVKAGLGWQGKHTNLINPKAGSWFFLGVLLIDLPLPVDPPFEKQHCGSCTACIDICPTQAITAPYQLDARRCISYLTIELKGSIPEPLRKLIGNRIYGCDDCQLICPWNKFAKTASEIGFHNQRGLGTIDLIECFSWDESTFTEKMQGSPIKRIGYQRWLRNIAVALGNAPTEATIITALQNRQNDPSELVREHVNWALQQHSAVPK